MPIRSWTAAAATALSLLAASVAAAGCGDDSSPSRAAGTFKPLTPGVLTVATTFPVAGFWEGSDIAHPSGGFEYELAEELADALDLVGVQVVDVSFSDLVRGKATGFDVGLAEVSVTPERRKRVDFSTTYLTTPVGVVGRSGTQIDDLAAARPLLWGVTDSTTEVDVVDDLVRPDTDAQRFPTLGEMLNGVVGGLVDVGATDFVQALIQVGQDDRLVLAAQITAPQHYAAVLPKGSKNLEAVNSAMRRLKADGTLDRLTDDLYAPYDVDQNDVPTIRVTPP
jgi:polar amino acid transport system substrate-binding protein